MMPIADDFEEPFSLAVPSVPTIGVSKAGAILRTAVRGFNYSSNVSQNSIEEFLLSGVTSLPAPDAKIRHDDNVKPPVSLPVRQQRCQLVKKNSRRD